MNYLLCYAQYLQICQTTCVCYCISKTKKNEFGQNPEENIALTGPGQYTKILTGSLTKTNRDNIIVKYNIYIIMWSCPGNVPTYYPGLIDILTDQRGVSNCPGNMPKILPR